MKIDYRQLELWQNLPRFYGVNQPQILSPIGPNDSAIAAHALTVGAIMVTTTYVSSSVFQGSPLKTGLKISDQNPAAKRANHVILTKVRISDAPNSPVDNSPFVITI